MFTHSPLGRRALGRNHSHGMCNTLSRPVFCRLTRVLCGAAGFFARRTLCSRRTIPSNEECDGSSAVNISNSRYSFSRSIFHLFKSRWNLRLSVLLAGEKIALCGPGGRSDTWLTVIADNGRSSIPSPKSESLGVARWPFNWPGDRGKRANVKTVE